MTALTILLAIACFSLGINASEHGKPKTGNHNFITAFISTVIQVGLIFWMLHDFNVF